MYLVATDRQGQVVGSIQLTPNPAIIGRSQTSALVLPSTSVSRAHASAYMRPEDGAVVIADQGSSNGVRVDGQVIGGPTLIDASNLVEISEFVLRVDPGQQPAVTPAVLPPGAPPPPGALQDVPTAGITAPPPEAQYPPPGMPQPPPLTQEAEEMGTILEPHAGAAQALAMSPRTLQLVGSGGTFDGTVFDLEQPLLFVGRTDDNQLPLNDPSVSRRHAQIRISSTGEGFTLLDLRSSNGTFVDGKRVKRVDCAPGSVVRFGELVFKVDAKQHAGGARPVAKKRSGKLLVGIAAAVFLALLGAGVVGYLTRKKPPPPKVITAEERLRQLQADVQRFIDEAKRRLDAKEWTLAVEACKSALGKDPLNAECKKHKTQAEKERANEATYEKGLKFFALGTEENLIKGKAIFAKVDQDSIYQREVRYKIQTINERLSERYRMNGLSQCKARYWRKCHVALCKFFALVPADRAIPGEQNLRKKVIWVEKKLARRKGFKGCTADRFLRPVDAISTEDPRKLLAAKYPQAKLRELLLVYVQGKMAMALKQLTDLRKKRSMRPHAATLSEVSRQLAVIRGKYEEGYSAYRARKVDDAQKHWDLVLDADRALLGEKIESFHRKEISRFLGDLYFELGNEQFKLGRSLQAYTHWAKGKLAAPKHQQLLNGLLQLEKQAEKLIQQGRALATQGDIASARKKLNHARDITESTSTLHKQALKALAGLGG